MKATATLSRTNRGTVVMTLEDNVSHIDFVEFEMDMAEFGKFVSGSGSATCNASVQGFDKLGKRKVTEDRSILFPVRIYDVDKLEAWLRDNVSEEDWTVNYSLRSQGSIVGQDNGILLNYTVTRYVDREDTRWPV